MPARYNLDSSKIVEMYESGKTFSKIAEIFNVSCDTIRKRLRENGIVLNPGRKAIIFDVEQAYSIYKSGNTIGNIAKTLNVSSATIIKNFKENGFERRRAGSIRKISINDDIFSIPNSSNCYWAGFIAADGNVQGNQLSIQLKDIDYEHLEKFINFAQLRGSKIFIRSNGKNRSCSVRFRSNQIIDDLKNNFNIAPNKSLVLQPPNLFDNDLIRHYIRGYFDGDGCLSINSNTGNMSFEIYSGSCDILEWILVQIKDNLDVSSRVGVRKKNRNVYRFGFCGNKQVPTITSWLYENCDSNFLKRKKSKFESIMTMEDY